MVRIFGQECTKFLLANYNLKKLIIYSRDENKQYLMAQKYNQKNVRYFIEMLEITKESTWP